MWAATYRFPIFSANNAPPHAITHKDIPMPLKIIGAGFGRTGTDSTRLALNQLGFPCYHMREVFGKTAHLDFWLKVANAPAGTQHDWETVFANYTAALDNPACCVWRELMTAYPDAKVLLTLHPKGAEAWYDSTMSTIYFTETMWQFTVLKYVIPGGRKLDEMTHKLVWQRSHRGAMADRAKAIAQYTQHIEDVKSAVPSDRLLIFSADQGWEPLCGFLGVSLPTGAFPKVNDRAAMKKAMKGMAIAGYGILAVAALAAASVVYGVLKLLD